VTISNTTGAAVTDVRYTRTMDWDVPPTEFREFVTLQGVGAGTLIDSCNDGFQSANPLRDCGQDGVSVSPYHEDVNFTDVGPTDHGARFTFSLGGLAAGESKTFNIFYGAAASEAAALAALAAVGGNQIYSLGQSSGGSTTGLPATFIFAFGGEDIGLPPPGAPEPGTLALLGGGLITVLARRYRRR
jgi:hypothetical protein